MPLGDRVEQAPRPGEPGPGSVARHMNGVVPHGAVRPAKRWLSVRRSRPRRSISSADLERSASCAPATQCTGPLAAELREKRSPVPQSPAAAPRARRRPCRPRAPHDPWAAVQCQPRAAAARAPGGRGPALQVSLGAAPGPWSAARPLPPWPTGRRLARLLPVPMRPLDQTRLGAVVSEDSGWVCAVSGNCSSSAFAIRAWSCWRRP